MSNNPHQLFLLADHVKLSLLERQRAQSLNLEPTKQDSHVSRSLDTLGEGLESLERQRFDDEAAGKDISTVSDQITRLQSQYNDLYTQFHGSSAPTSNSTLTKPNDPTLSADFSAASSTPRTSRPAQARNSSLRGKQKSPTPKNVRFRDNPSASTEEDDVENRTALFDRPYSDEPDGAEDEQANLSNQQIHAYHKQVIQDQDSQLDVLGQSIRRQGELSIQMGTELDEQAVLLDDVDEGVDRHQGALDRGNARIKSISRKAKDNWSWLTIGILIIVLVLLIVLLKT